MSQTFLSVEWRQAYVADTEIGRMLVCRVRGAFDGYLNGIYVASGLSPQEAKQRTIIAAFDLGRAAKA